jgi:hypothetical protein
VRFQVKAKGGAAVGVLIATGRGSGGDLEDLKYEEVAIYQESGGPGISCLEGLDSGSCRHLKRNGLKYLLKV